MLTIPSNRRPTAPGELLQREFLEPLEMTQTALARHLGITTHRLNEIIRGRRGVTPDTALRLERVLGVSAAFWLNAQLAVDLYDAQHSKEAKKIAKLEPVRGLGAA